MLEKKDLIIKKHSGMIQTHVGNMTLTQRKLINFLIYIAQKVGDQKFYKTTISDVKEVCNLPSTENISVKEQLKDLAKITIEFNYLDKDKYNAWGISSLLASAVVTPNLGTVVFEFSNLLKDRILNPSMYAPLNILLIAGLKCSYAVILYEFLRDYLTSPAVPMMDIEEFRNLLGVDESKYKSFPDFRRKVLNPAVEEINLKTDICCRFELIKEAGVRNKYSHIRFFVSKKTGDLTYEKIEDVKKEKADFSMDLFENSPAQVNKTAVQIPECIMSEIPDNKKTEAVKEVITTFLEKGPDYIIPNIRYSLKNAKDNFPAYLKKSLAEDYAKHDREVENKKKEKVVLKAKEMVQKHKGRVEAGETLEKIKTLPENAYNELRNTAVEELGKIYQNNPFGKREVLIELKMVELYEKSKSSEYSPGDRD